VVTERSVNRVGAARPRRLQAPAWSLSDEYAPHATSQAGGRLARDRAEGLAPGRRMLNSASRIQPLAYSLTDE